MSTIIQSAPKAQTPQQKPQNPAASAGSEPKGARKRIPMSTPQQRLQTPELPGWYLYWHLESNVPAAMQAGYEFVGDDELTINQRSVATNTEISGNADLGSRIRVLAGIGQSGEPEYHVLMKLPWEDYLSDRREIDGRNASILQNIFVKEEIMGSENIAPSDKEQRYVKKALLQRPMRKK